MPDPDAFPDFDDNLREAFQRETELFLDSQMREDQRAGAADGELHVRQRAPGEVSTASRTSTASISGASTSPIRTVRGCSVRAAS